MNNDLERFSEERLKELAEMCESKALGFPASHAESAALARIALAVKQANPMAYTDNLALETLQENGMACMWKKGNGAEWREQIPLYTTPQPAHTEQDGWIKCSERMPDDARDVTVLSKEHGVVNGYYWSGLHWGKDVVPSWFISCGTHEGKADDITHWMPLPADPKPESE